MTTIARNKIDDVFKGVDVDYSKFEGSVEQAQYIANFITKYVKRGVPLKLVAYGLSSSFNDLKILNEDSTLVTFRPNTGQYDLKNIYSSDELIVKVEHHDVYFYYIEELIKNLTFSNYIVKDDQSYIHSTHLKRSDIGKRLNVFSNNDYNFDYGVASIEDDGIVYRFSKYSIFVNIKINEYGTTFCFSGRHGVPNNVHVQAVYFKSFHELVCHMNKYVYDNIVENVINVAANEFRIEHREIMKMIDI